MEKLIFPVTKKAAEKKWTEVFIRRKQKRPVPLTITELRSGRGISQETLAHDLGVSKSTIGLYETGDTLPDAQTLHDLSVYFGVSADWLLGLSDYRDNVRRELHLRGLDFQRRPQNRLLLLLVLYSQQQILRAVQQKISTVNNPNGYTCQQEARAFLALNILLESPEFVLALSNAWAYMRYSGQFDSSKSMVLGGESLPEPFFRLLQSIGRCVME